MAANSEATGATIEAGKNAAEQALEIAGNSVAAAASASCRATKQAVEPVKADAKK